jgi:2-keto-3-deoxy-L-rhamnonate aldolase RhmA
MNAAFRRVAEVCGRSPVAPGTYMQDLSRLIELKAAGFRFLVLASDLDLMMKALKDAMDGLRGAG